jgi:hypothetical protein
VVFNHFIDNGGATALQTIHLTIGASTHAAQQRSTQASVIARCKSVGGDYHKLSISVKHCFVFTLLTGILSSLQSIAFARSSDVFRRIPSYTTNYEQNTPPHYYKGYPAEYGRYFVPPRMQHSSLYNIQTPPFNASYSPAQYSLEYPYNPHYYPPPIHHYNYPRGNRSTSPIIFIRELLPHDILSGRGGATNSHAGNQAFRNLIKSRQRLYLKAKKRDKPGVARTIVEMIRKNGGRFLEKYNPRGGEIVYVDIGDERAREKVSQALREGAPELRRKKRVSSDESVCNNNQNNTEDDDDTTKRSSVGKEKRDDGSSHDGSGHDHNQNNSSSCLPSYTSSDKTRADNSAIMIYPCARFMPKRRRVEPFPVNQLDKRDRDLYLSDFLPPCPSVQQYAAPSCSSTNEWSDVHA